jgi:hypothetical protein
MMFYAMNKYIATILLLSCKKCSMPIKHEGSILELAMSIVMDISKYLV